MKRRTFLKLMGAGALTTIGGGALYLRDNDMIRPLKREGQVLADLHSHPANYKSLDETLEMLSSGLTGLAFIDCGAANKILTYEQAIKLPGAEEVDSGLFAKITSNGKRGYFVKAQEILSDFHILVIGAKEKIPYFEDARKVVEEARKLNPALIQLNHPYVVANNHPIIKYRFINEEEERKVRELCQMVDQVEVFNAQNINTLVPGIPNMNLANYKAKILAEEFGFNGTASSDAHLRLEQVGISGIYLDEKNLNLDSLKEQVKRGNFERREQYVSRWSFGLGMFVG